MSLLHAFEFGNDCSPSYAAPPPRCAEWLCLSVEAAPVGFFGEAAPRDRSQKGGAAKHDVERRGFEFRSQFGQHCGERIIVVSAVEKNARGDFFQTSGPHYIF